MSLKPWYKVITPREDLCEGKPLDAAEFAVHLDQVRDGNAPEDYKDPRRFFEKTFLTKNLTALAVEVIRRLNGEIAETSSIFNMSTQFGGGKTHALTLLYHLANGGPLANEWVGVEKLIQLANVRSIPKAAIAVFVGTEFDSITGRGGEDGTPIRKTLWGEIAFQLGGIEGLNIVAEHERQMIAPAGDVINKLLPKDKPCLILIDELMNYISRNRKSGLSAQVYDFLHNLSETARGRKNVVLAASIPASELEMNQEDQSDYERLKKLLDRLGKAVIMSAETETSEIIRRRLFEWDSRAIGQNGKAILPKEAIQTCREYADMLYEHRQQIPGWFQIDAAAEAFEATYPFHPTVLSMFERKWQVLPRFQQTRGVLRLLASWVSKAYQEGYKGAHKDSLIGTGTAPLDDAFFRAAVFEQLGESKLEGAVTTDICGKKDSHAIRLDAEAVDIISRSRLHRKVASTIFFESNGGMAKSEATLPEIRLAVAEPEIDIGNIETVIDNLSTNCYYLSNDKNRFRFSTAPNLNKLLADRRASIKQPQIDECMKSEISSIFFERKSLEVINFPEKTSQIPDRPVLTLVVVPPDLNILDKRTLASIENMVQECGSGSRTYKSALVYSIADSDSSIKEEARKLLAWKSIKEEEHEHRFDDSQRRQLDVNLSTTKRDLRESIWRSYKHIALLDKSNKIRIVDLGLVHSSASDSITAFILNRLQQDGDLESSISPNFLLRNWPPAFVEWSTKAVRDAFFASPQFPKLLNQTIIKETIAKGVINGYIAYIGKSSPGNYSPFIYKRDLPVDEVEISEDMYIITNKVAEEYLKQIYENQGNTESGANTRENGNNPKVIDNDQKDKDEPLRKDITKDDDDKELIKFAIWSGELSAPKWMNFYTKVLSKYAVGNNLKLTLTVEISNEEGISKQKIEETKISLRELALNDYIKIE